MSFVRWMLADLRKLYDSGHRAASLFFFSMAVLTVLSCVFVALVFAWLIVFDTSPIVQGVFVVIGLIVAVLWRVLVVDNPIDKKSRR